MLFAAIDRRRAPAPEPEKVAWLAGYTYAHRGLHGDTIPENSLAAFAAAMDRGLGIECDVQRSGDGQAVVFHDWDLDRLSGASGPVVAHSAARLGQITLNGSAETIPTLTTMLAEVAGKVPLLIELKSRGDKRIHALCLAVRGALEGYAGHYAVMSFDPRVSRWFARYAPHIVRGLVITEANARTLTGVLRRHMALWHARPDFLAYDIRDLPGNFPAAQRRRGLPLLSWTVNSPELAERAARYVDAAIAEGAGVP